MNFTKISMLLLGAFALWAACSPGAEPGQEQATNQQNQTDMTNNIYELAINKAKPGQYSHFLDTRAKFVEVLGKEDNTLNEGKWKPFFTVGDMNLEDVLIGMTHWNAMQGFGESASKLMPQQVAKDYFSSFDPLAYVLLETADGQPFDMETIKKEGSVVEFAIRSGKTADAFGPAREAFFKSLGHYEGYQFAREFKVYQLDENSMPQFQEGTQAVVIVWENAAAFQAAAGPIFASPEYADFAKNLEVSAYFASSPAS